MTPGGGMPLYIAGTGSFAIEIAGWASDCTAEIGGFIEIRDASRVGSTIGGTRVVDLRDAPADVPAVIGLGGDRRESRRLLEDAGWRAGGFVHPTAHVAETARVSGSATIGPLTVVGAEAEIGDHAILSRGVLLGHHARVGEFATLNPGANVGGNAKLGADAFLGMGCVVLNNIEVGAGAIVAAGAVTIRNVPAGARVQGVPAVPYPGG